MHINLHDLESDYVYALMTQAVVPRPVAWVLSDNGNGAYNLAPFSYFNALCSDPPLVMLSIGWKNPETRKDSWINIEERREFVIHIAHRELLDALNASSATLPHGDSELKHVGLETFPWDGFRLPRLKDARIAMACERYGIQVLGNKDQGLIFGRIRHIYLDDNIVEQHGHRLKVDPKKLDPIARLGFHQFSLLGEVVSLKRPP